MKNRLITIFGWLASLLVIGAFVYFFRADFLPLKDRLYQQFLPCKQPITYELGEFDTRFGISQKDFLIALTAAEEIWEKPIGLNLFAYAPSGTLKINLIYDYRQDTTDKLRQVDTAVKEDRATYEKLKSEYIALQKSLAASKKILDKKISEVEQRVAAYNAKVASWNERGGVPPSEVDQIREEKNTINKLIAELKILQNNYNARVSELNALAKTLNRLAKALNISVNTYNTIGADLGREFEEGTYISSAAGQQIDIYQFDNQQKLVRVLTHEFGHALGLEHVSSTKAIMYYLNNGVNSTLTPVDLNELKRRCGVE